MKLAKHLVVMVSVLVFLMEGFRALGLAWLDPNRYQVSGIVQNPTQWFAWSIGCIAAVWVLEVFTTGRAVSIAAKASRNGDASTSEQPAAV